MKNILVISTSLRKSGNSETIADRFIKGATEVGHNVEKISLSTKNMGFCKGCLLCQKTQKCILKDDVNDILQTMKKSDVIVFATPIYFYEMSGQMKTFLDRTNPLFASNYTFRDIYLIATAADTALESLDGALKGLQGWLDCFEKTRLVEVIKGLGLEKENDSIKNVSLLEKAYCLGKKVK